MGTVVPMAQGAEEVVVRFYNKTTDLAKVVDWERKCEAGPGGQVALLQDVLGDPLCRVRHFPAYSMLVKTRLRRFDCQSNPALSVTGLLVVVRFLPYHQLVAIF